MKNQDMKQNGGVNETSGPSNAGDDSWFKYLSGIITDQFTNASSFTQQQLGKMSKLIGENPVTAIASAALAGIALSTYLHIRMQGTKEDKDALDRKIREARRESEESSDSNSDNRRRKSNRQRSFSEDGSSSSSRRRRVNKSKRGSRGSRRRR